MPDHDIISEHIGHMYAFSLMVSQKLELLINLYQDGWNGYNVDNYHLSVLGT